MPLSDREQKILAEIERHFYEEDPALARAVRNIDRNPRTRSATPVAGSRLRSGGHRCNVHVVDVAGARRLRVAGRVGHICGAGDQSAR